MWCFNRNVLIGLGVVALGVLALQPGAIGAALPVLVLLACPLSMLVMMRGMNRANAEPETSTAPDPEVVGLRSEVDQLRAELSAKSDGTLAE